MQLMGPLLRIRDYPTWSYTVMAMINVCVDFNSQAFNDKVKMEKDVFSWVFGLLPSIRVGRKMVKYFSNPT